MIRNFTVPRDVYTVGNLELGTFSLTGWEPLFFVIYPSHSNLVSLPDLHLQGKPQTLALKRKAESEEERDDVATLSSVLPSKTSPAVESPEALEEKGGLGGECLPPAVLLEHTAVRGTFRVSSGINLT